MTSQQGLFDKEQDSNDQHSSQADSPASPFLLPGSDAARKMTVTSGRKCCALLDSSDPVGLLVKMLLGSEVWLSTLRYLQWKVKEIPKAIEETYLLEKDEESSTPSWNRSKRKVIPSKRYLFQLAASEPPTSVTESSLWPTPRAGTPGSRKPGTGGKVLAEEVRKNPKMWRTPTSRDWKGPHGREYKAEEGIESLPGQVLFPTPRGSEGGVGMCGGTGSRQMLQDKKDAGEITEEERVNMQSGSGGSLNPDWVELLMGFPPGWTRIGNEESPE